MLSNDCSKIWGSFIVIPTSMLSWELCVFVLATYALTKVDVQECVFVLTGTIRGQQSNCLVHRSWFWVWGFSTSGLSGGRETACVQGGWVMMPEASASACTCMSVGGLAIPSAAFSILGGAFLSGGADSLPSQHLSLMITSRHRSSFQTWQELFLLHARSLVRRASRCLTLDSSDSDEAKSKCLEL